MAITNIGTNSTNRVAGAGTGVTVTLSQTVTAGNVLIAAIFGDSIGLGASVAASASGNPMTLFQVGGSNLFNLFKLENCPAGITQVVFSGANSGTGITGICAEFNPTTTANDSVSDTGVSSASPWTTNSVTTTGDDLIILGLRVSANSVTFTVNSPYTIAKQTFGGTLSCGLAWGEQTGPGSYTASGTSSSGTTRITIGALLVPPVTDDVITIRKQLNLSIA